MKKPVLISLYVVLLSLLVWGFITPNGVRAAAENNAWSISFLKYFYNYSSSPLVLPPPPSTHVNAGLLLTKEAMKKKNYSLALELISPMVKESDPLALNLYAQILYLQEQYDLAFKMLV